MTNKTKERVKSIDPLRGLVMMNGISLPVTKNTYTIWPVKAILPQLNKGMVEFEILENCYQLE